MLLVTTRDVLPSHPGGFLKVTLEAFLRLVEGSAGSQNTPGGPMDWINGFVYAQILVSTEGLSTDHLWSPSSDCVRRDNAHWILFNILSSV